MSEILERADEIREAAKGCEKVLDLARKLNWPIQSAAAANDQLNLGLPEIRQAGRDGVRRVAEPCPKPTGKGAKS
jgi:hypothetical protein